MRATGRTEVTAAIYDSVQKRFSKCTHRINKIELPRDNLYPETTHRKGEHSKTRPLRDNYLFVGHWTSLHFLHHRKEGSTCRQILRRSKSTRHFHRQLHRRYNTIIPQRPSNSPAAFAVTFNQRARADRKTRKDTFEQPPKAYLLRRGR